ncbi:PKD domain-containing protein [Micromonospora sp. NPDC007230]|uniref:PKD domain-containing protein n=1 Tax=Micromonospora sp. NPDC007230 TaxID=3364237 RepID=UPI00367E5D96
MDNPAHYWLRLAPVSPLGACMHRHTMAGLAAIAVTGGSLLSATPAQAADPAVLYVRQLSTACSDTGPGTLEQPFCSIAPAAAMVSAGQTVDVGNGIYREHITITRSGTPDQPIVFRSPSPTSRANLVGSTAGFTIDGQHDIQIQRFLATGATDLPALDLRNASGIIVEGGSFGVADGSSAPAVRLAGVSQSAVTRSHIAGQELTAGVTLDAATTGVSLTALTINGATSYSVADHSVGIRVDGIGNAIRNNVIGGFTGAAITVEAGASSTLVVNNHITGGAGHGIRNHGGVGTAITNNTVRNRCRDGIRVDGASSGVSVQNNLLIMNGPFGQTGCEPSVELGVEIGVHDGAVKDTVVDYNNADHYSSPSPRIYAWNGVQMSLSAFRAASGRAAHDLETYDPRAAYDSANSAAPGYPATDRLGTARVDDPAVPNTGAGPVTYADRGALETIRSPLARTSVTLDLAAATVKVDATTSDPGFAPIESYRFDFGDGTSITQTSPVASHHYAKPGEYAVSTKVTGTDGRSGTRTDQISVLRWTGTVGLLALDNLNYVAPPPVGTQLRSYQAGLTAAGQFDLADAGSGQVAILSRATGTYVAAGYAGAAVTMTTVRVTDPQRFTLLRNADGSISLKSVAGGRYVSATSADSYHLVADKTTIGTTEKFYRVTVTGADRSLKARTNNQYVTADSAGVKPLTANRTSRGLAERFDLVDLGNGQVALLARANNRFVTADNAGAKPLIANHTSVGSWERFTLVRNADLTVSLRAGANNRYVTADRSGRPLIADCPSPGIKQRFILS